MVKRSRRNYEFKPEFKQRIKKLLGKDSEEFYKICLKPLRTFIRVNTLKISVEDLKKKLKNKGWEIEQPFNFIPEAI